MLQLNDITVSFEDNHILKDLSCHIESGDFIIIVGTNGAGKSTLFNIIAGKNKPDKGTVLFEDKDITHLSESERSNIITRIFQNTYLNSVGILTVLENLALSTYSQRSVKMVNGMNNMPEKKAKELLNDLGISESILHTPMNKLSGGQRQLIAFVMATQIKPKILLLDEPTAALDPQASTALLTHATQFIKKNKITTLLITHDPYIALNIGNKIWVLENGKITKQFNESEKKLIQPNQLIGQINYALLQSLN